MDENVKKTVCDPGEFRDSFGDILTRGEKVLWMGKPSNYLSYLFGSSVWGIFIVPLVIGGSIFNIDGLIASAIFGVLLTFFVGHGMYRNTSYAFTDKRAISHYNYFISRTNSVDYDQIRSVTLRKNVFDAALGTGTVVVTGGSGASFHGIGDYSDVYNKIRTATVDVKSDWYYPNSNRRGSKNRGYRTAYEPGEDD